MAKLNNLKFKPGDIVKGTEIIKIELRNIEKTEKRLVYHRIVTCKCLKCGNVFKRKYNCLSSKNSKLHCDKCEPVGRNTVYKSKYFVSGLLSIFYHRAKGLGRDFNLTLEDLDELYEKQNGKCYYTGEELILPATYQFFATMDRNSFNVSIDRKDSSFGYSKENCVLCIKDVNIAKQNLSVSDFIQLCKEVTKCHQKI